MIIGISGISIPASRRRENPELVINGGFDTAADWQRDIGATISGGVAILPISGGRVLQAATTGTPGVTYDVSFEIVAKSGSTGSLQLTFGGAGSAFFASVGVQSFQLTASTTGALNVQHLGGSSGDYTIDNVSVKRA